MESKRSKKGRKSRPAQDENPTQQQPHHHHPWDEGRPIDKVHLHPHIAMPHKLAAHYAYAAWAVCRIASPVMTVVDEYSTSCILWGLEMGKLLMYMVCTCAGDQEHYL